MYREESTTYIDAKGDIKWHRNKIVEEGTIKSYHSEKERYYSLFAFDDAINEYVKLHQTVTGFNGKVYCDYVWFDMDSKDLEQARKDTIQFIKNLNQKFGLSTADIFIYFSGNKGFHIALHSKLFGGIEPSVELADRIKVLAERLTEGLKSADFVIYEKVRAFRKENSKNVKSGLYKIELTYNELLLGIDTIKIMAEKPRDFIRSRDINSIYTNELLAKEWNDILNTDFSKQVKENNFTEDSGFWKPKSEPGRHTHLYRQAAMLFDKSELAKSAIYEIMIAQNERCNPPITDLKELVDSAYKKTSKNIKKQEFVIKPFSGWIDEFIDHLFHPASLMTTGFSSFDTILRKRLKGKLGCIVGYGGSKKSLFAMNSCLKNIHLHNCVAIYSTMEMNTSELMERITDYMVEADYCNATQQLEKMSRDEARKILSEQVAPLFGNKLYITQNNSLTCVEYDKMISKVVSETGKIDMLIVDGLSMMGGEGKETERYSDNTRDLKETANKWNIFIQLMCHVSKGAEKHTRDLTNMVRGSEKIFDNCDFVITMSQLIDEKESSEETAEYRKDKGYARLYDKRGSGMSSNKIYDFNSYRLSLEESNDPPKMYEVKRKKKKTESKDFVET